MSTLYDFDATDIRGQEIDLEQYRGKAVLVVNTASKCGLTPQYKGLEELYKTYGDDGLVILGFPCDQFAHQEPGDEAQIEEFCQLNYGVSFPMFAKVDVNGSDTHPLYEWLKSEKGGLLGNRIKWNFTKFLVGRDGKVIDRYAPAVKPEKISADIESALAD